MYEWKGEQQGNMRRGVMQKEGKGCTRRTRGRRNIKGQWAWEEREGEKDHALKMTYIRGLACPGLLLSTRVCSGWMHLQDGGDRWETLSKVTLHPSSDHPLDSGGSWHARIHAHTLTRTVWRVLGKNQMPVCRNNKDRNKWNEHQLPETFSSTASNSKVTFWVMQHTEQAFTYSTGQYFSQWTQAAPVLLESIKTWFQHLLSEPENCISQNSSAARNEHHHNTLKACFIFSAGPSAAASGIDTQKSNCE